MMIIMENEHSEMPELAEGERLLWQGKPTKVTLLDGVMRTRIIVTWIICAVIMVLSLYFAFFALAETTLGRRVVLLVIFNMVPALVIWNTFRDVSGLRHKTHYFVTNQRVLVRSPYSDFSLELSKGLPAEEGRENRSVRLGKAVGIRPARERSACLANSIRDDEGKAEGIVLAYLEDPKAVLRIIREQTA